MTVIFSIIRCTFCSGSFQLLRNWCVRNFKRFLYISPSCWFVALIIAWLTCTLWKAVIFFRNVSFIHLRVLSFLQNVSILCFSYFVFYMVYWRMHYLLNQFNYLLTLCSGVLLGTLTGSQLVKHFRAFYGTWRFITAFTNTHYVSLSWARTIHSITHIPLPEDPS